MLVESTCYSKIAPRWINAYGFSNDQAQRTEPVVSWLGLLMDVGYHGN